jgi:hypothetical protein
MQEYGKNNSYQNGIQTQFPVEHTDMMQTTIMYNVPEDKMDDLGMFDGSVTFDRTQGTMRRAMRSRSKQFFSS